jgi:hypothetical protein
MSITTNPNPYICNIPELQNVITSASGTTPVTDVTNAIAALYTYIDTTTATAYFNTITSYTGDSILIAKNLDLQNTALYINNILSVGPSLINGVDHLSCDVNGVEVGRFAANGDLTITGDLHAKGILYPSDPRLKANMRPYTPRDLPHPIEFEWKSTNTRDIGVRADELLEIEPACVKNTPAGTLVVDYPKLTVLLLAEVRALKEAVARLEAASIMPTSPAAPSE